MKRYDQTNSANCSPVDATVRRNFMPFFSSLWFPVAAVPSVTWRRCLWSWEESLLSSSSATVTWTRLFAWWESDADRERVMSGHTGGLSGCFLHHVSAKAVSRWVHLFTDREFTSNHVLYIHGVLCRICRSLVAITAFKVSPSFVAQRSRRREIGSGRANLENEWIEGAAAAKTKQWIREFKKLLPDCFTVVMFWSMGRGKTLFFKSHTYLVVYVSQTCRFQDLGFKGLTITCGYRSTAAVRWNCNHPVHCAKKKNSATRKKNVNIYIYVYII